MIMKSRYPTYVSLVLGYGGGVSVKSEVSTNQVQSTRLSKVSSSTYNQAGQVQTYLVILEDGLFSCVTFSDTRAVFGAMTGYILLDRVPSTTRRRVYWVV
ncbi:hypothetical protein THAOC_33567, partial [Thalassiosira oceanica]